MLYRCGELQILTFKTVRMSFGRILQGPSLGRTQEAFGEAEDVGDAQDAARVGERQREALGRLQQSLLKASEAVDVPLRPAQRALPDLETSERTAIMYRAALALMSRDVARWGARLAGEDSGRAAAAAAEALRLPFIPHDDRWKLAGMLAD